MHILFTIVRNSDANENQTNNPSNKKREARAESHQRNIPAIGNKFKMVFIAIQ